MALLTDISKRVQDLFSPQKSPLPQRKQIQVKKNFVSQFANSPVGQALVGAQRAIEQAPQTLSQNINLIRTNPRFAQQLPEMINQGIQQGVTQTYGNNLATRTLGRSVGNIEKGFTRLVTTPFARKDVFGTGGDVLAGVGAITKPATGLGFGGFSAAIQAGSNLINRRPIGENVASEFEKGTQSGFQFAALEPVVGKILGPLANKIAPTQIKSINQYINLAKSATTPKARNEIIKLMSKRIAQNVLSSSTKGAVTFGGIGAVEDSKTLEERLNKTFQNALTGAVFSGGSTLAGYGAQALGGQIIKPLIQYSKANQQGKVGFGTKVGQGAKPNEQQKPMLPIEREDTAKILERMVNQTGNADYEIRFRARDEAALRDTASFYMNKDFAKNAPIQQVGQELLTRLKLDAKEKAFNLPSISMEKPTKLWQPPKQKSQNVAQQGGETIVNPKTGETLNDAIAKLEKYGWRKQDIQGYKDKILGVNQLPTENPATTLTSLNPTGGLYVDYTPQARMNLKLGRDITTYDKTSGLKPDQMVTIYRGVSKTGRKINPGDFITTDPNLAKSYGSNIIEKQVPASHILDDIKNPGAGEYIYRPSSNSRVAQQPLSDIGKLKYHTPQQVADFKNNILTPSNTQKTLSDFQSVGGNLNQDGSITLYRGASSKLSDNIRPQSYFTTELKTAKKFGTVSEIKVDPQALMSQGKSMATGGITFINPAEMVKGSDGVYRVPSPPQPSTLSKIKSTLKDQRGFLRIGAEVGPQGKSTKPSSPEIIPQSPSDIRKLNPSYEKEFLNRLHQTEAKLGRKVDPTSSRMLYDQLLKQQNESYLYHGTTPEAIQSIKALGFKPIKGNNEVYFATHPDVTKQYGKSVIKLAENNFDLLDSSSERAKNLRMQAGLDPNDKQAVNQTFRELVKNLGWDGYKYKTDRLNADVEIYNTEKLNNVVKQSFRNTERQPYGIKSGRKVSINLSDANRLGLSPEANPKLDSFSKGLPGTRVSGNSTPIITPNITPNSNLSFEHNSIIPQPQTGIIPRQPGELVPTGNFASRQGPQGLKPLEQNISGQQGALGGGEPPIQPPKQLGSGSEQINPQSSSNAIVENVKSKVNKLYTETLDRFHPLSSIANKAGEDTAMRRALTGHYGAGSTAQYHIDYELAPILKSTDVNELRKAAIALRDAELKTRGIQGSNTDALSELLSKQGKNGLKDPAMGDALKKLYKYQDSLVQEYLVKTGIMTQDSYKKMKANNQFYVPFKRVMENVDEWLGTTPQKTGVGSVGSQNIIQKIKGSKRAIEDPLESIIENTYKIVGLGKRQEVARTLASLKDKLPEGTIVKVKGKGLNPNNYFSVFENGKVVHYKAPQEVVEAAKGMNQDQISTIVKILAAPTKVFRATATGLNPEFMLPNVTRDVQSAFVNIGLNPLKFVSGLSHYMKRDSVYQDFLKSGGLTSQVSLDRPYLKKTVGEIASTKRGISVLKGGNLFEILSKIGQASEQPTRLAAFQKALKDSLNKGVPREQALQDAAYAAQEATVNFARRGSKTQAANMLYAFMNARAQGTDRLIRSIKADPKGAGFRVGMLTLAPALGLYAYNRNFSSYNDERIIPPYEKENNFILMLSDRPIEALGGAQYIKIPKGDIGKLANPIESFLNYADGKGGDVQKSLVDAVKAFLPGNNAGDLLPTATRPVVEAAANYNFFYNRPIVSDSKKDYPAKFQTNKNTSVIYKELGQKLNYSPAKIENLVRGYLTGFARIGEMFARPFDKNSSYSGKDINQTPVARRFFGGAVRTEEEQQLNNYFKQKGILDKVQSIKTGIKYGNIPIEDGMNEINKLLQNNQKELKTQPQSYIGFSSANASEGKSLQSELQDNMLKLQVEQTGKAIKDSYGNIIYRNENGNAATINLAQPTKGAGIGAFANRDWNITKAREIWNNDQIPKEMKDQTIKDLGLDSENVRYDALANYDNDIKAQYLSSKSQTKDDLINNILTGRVRSISDKLFASDGVIDAMVDEGRLTKEEAKYLKSIDYDKNGNLKSGGKGRRGTKLKLPTPKALPVLQFSKRPLYKAPKLGTKIPKAPRFSVKKPNTKAVFAKPSKERLTIRTVRA